MRKLSMPVLGDEVSVYVLGTMYFGSKVAEQDALRLMDIYADRGGNIFDSANKYASWVPGFEGGESERVVGKWLKGKPRDRYVVTSKLGFPYGDVPQSLDPKYIISECERSLQRLGVDYIDLYFAHVQDPATPIEETLRAFDVLLQSGKVRAIGASNFDAWRLDEARCKGIELGLPQFAAFQQRYSLLQPLLGADLGTQQVLTPEQIDYCAVHGLLMMGYSPLLGGLYEKPDDELPIQYRAEHNYNRLALLRMAAEEAGCTPSALVLAWMAAQSPAVLPLVTASKPKHLEQNLKEVDHGAVRDFVKAIDNLDRFTVKYS